jgi:capsular exopolysaccharide synthesis family protein
MKSITKLERRESPGRRFFSVSSSSLAGDSGGGGQARASASPEEDISPALRDIPAVHVVIPDDTRLVTVSEPHGPGADRFRYLRLHLRELRKRAKIQAIAITSPLPKEGKSTVAMNLAHSLSEHGKKTVLCIEADLYHQTVTEAFALASPQGLIDCVEDGLDPLSAVLRLDPLGWYVLPAGSKPTNPTEVIHSPNFPNVLAKLRPHFDWIVLDTPPLLPLSDTVTIAGITDGTLLVIRAGQTPKESVEESLRIIGPRKALGLVLNDSVELNTTYSKYYGSYYKTKQEA